MPVNGLKCVQCESIFHPGCIKYLKDIIKISDSEVVCCVKNSAEETSTPPRNGSELDDSFASVCDDSIHTTKIEN